MKFKITIFVIALALFAMLVSACGTTTPFKSDALDGTSWELVAISKHPPIEESQISILFENIHFKFLIFKKYTLLSLINI